MATNGPRERMVDFSIFSGVPESYLGPSARAYEPAMGDGMVDFSILGGWAGEAQPIGPSYEDWTADIRTSVKLGMRRPTSRRSTADVRSRPGAAMKPDIAIC